MMKTIVVIFTILISSWSLAGEVLLFTTSYPLGVAVLALTQGIKNISVRSLTPVGLDCPHHYQLSARDWAQLTKASGLLVNGLGFEPFAENISRRYPQLPVLNASHGISAENPHIWGDPSMMAVQVESSANFLTKILPQQKEQLQKNAQSYQEKLQQLAVEMDVWRIKNRGKRALVLSGPLFYWAQKMGLEVVKTVEKEMGETFSAKELAELIRLAKEKKVHFILGDRTRSEASDETLSREMGVPLLLLDPLIRGPWQSDAYLRAMKNNLAWFKTFIEKEKL
jgi:zinc transport system substrate-binding protein